VIAGVALGAVAVILLTILLTVLYYKRCVQSNEMPHAVASRLVTNPAHSLGGLSETGTAGSVGGAAGAGKGGAGDGGYELYDEDAGSGADTHSNTGEEDGTYGAYGARFSAEIHTRGCHWFPRLLT
jgi:hypothetical protein